MTRRGSGVGEPRVLPSRRAPTPLPRRVTPPPFVVAFLGGVALAALAACSQSPPAETAGALAQSGRGVFSSQCARCHGDQGQGLIGPALIGPSAGLAKFGSADELSSFVSQSMPQDHPGALDQHAYLEVVSYLLVQNGDVSPSAPLDQSKLVSIRLRP